MISEPELSRLFTELHDHLKELCEFGKVTASRSGTCCRYAVVATDHKGFREFAVIGPLEIEYRSKELRGLAVNIVDCWRAKAIKQGATS